MKSWKRWSALLVLAVAVVHGLWDASSASGVASARPRSDETQRVSEAKPGATGATDAAEVLGVYFTPPAGAGKALVQWIDQAQHEVIVQAYGFTHNAIAQALLRAHERGVRVAVLLDQKSSSTNRYVIDLLQAQRIALKFDGRHAIAHNKVMVIDQRVVVTGSFNFTNSAETRNAENLLVLRSDSLASRYRDNWQAHWDHALDSP